ncbi:hypothetical protein ACIA5G_39685 [Amycolatopsis sp. NPDC051758]|uniref:hypothetical protein n=1 Tax=Amycolatopsis sp. NPDC051758 TaxID=3363935 RepID=UPI00379DCCDC
MTASLSCACYAAITSVIADGTGADEALAAYEYAAFEAMASGARFYVRWHDTGHTQAEAAEELHRILRRLRITLALLEKQVADNPPARQAPGALGADLRSLAYTYGRIAARLYRAEASLDAGITGEHQPARSSSGSGSDLW